LLVRAAGSRGSTELRLDCVTPEGRPIYAHLWGKHENETEKQVSSGRHKRYCKICSHEKREEIEQGFISWKSPIVIAEDYGLADRMNVYRHATALGLFEKRRRNIRTALERIIERAHGIGSVNSLT